MSGNFSPTNKKKPTLKPDLYQGRKRVDPSKHLPQSLDETESFHTDIEKEEDEEDRQTFQISVSIGGEKK